VSREDVDTFVRLASKYRTMKRGHELSGQDAEADTVHARLIDEKLRPLLFAIQPLVLARFRRHDDGDCPVRARSPHIS